MVKQITEDDLAAGLSGFGDGLTTITERPRRDNPFRDTRAEVERRPCEKVEKVVEMRPGGAPGDSQGLGTPNERETRPEVRPERRITGRGLPAEPVERLEVPYARELPVRTIEESAKEVRVHYPEPETLSEKAQLRKADIFTERVTLSMSTEMRDEVEAL